MLDAKKKCVTVTGTPGIGKSVFYAYFFQRFQAETKDTWIIAITYDMGIITSVTVFEDGGSVEDFLYRSKFEEGIGTALERAHAQKKKVVFLCDGTPDGTRGRTQMVVFTSPNQRWLRAVRKLDCTLYMPLWACEELQVAAWVLGLMENGVDCEVIETRYNIFGGVARGCLSLTEGYAERAKDSLVREIQGISNPQVLENLVNGVETGRDCHRVRHYVPVENRCVATVVASPFVVQKLAERMLKSAKGDGEKLRASLESFSQGELLSEWIFEDEMHEQLQQGCTLSLRLLQSSDDNSDAQVEQSITIPASSKPNVFDLKGLSPRAATRGPYHKPALKQFESIDSFFLPKMDRGGLEVTAQDIIAWNVRNRLFLFKMTISKTQSVNASGILLVLDKLGLPEVVKRHPERAALVFVVPPAKAEGYERQDITPEVMEGTVKGIGKKAGNFLAQRGIYSINQLKAAVKNNVLSPEMIPAQGLLNLKGVRDSSYSDAMAKIPQYVIKQLDAG